MREVSTTSLKLQEAAQKLFLLQGYTATTVADICSEAQCSKGAFFHYFKNKEELTISATESWAAQVENIFSTAPYKREVDPLDRVLGYIDFRTSTLDAEVAEFTCLLGTLVQETYASHPPIRATCEKALSSHIAILIKDLEDAKQLYAPYASWTSDSAGFFMQSVLQGSFIFAKARMNAGVVRENLLHLRSYIENLFNHGWNWVPVT